jgi:hypothetical protein
MAYVTNAELQQLVAEKLGLVPTGQTVAADDGAKIGETLVGLQEQLAQERIAFFDVNTGVDPAYQEPLVAMAAAHLVDDFGIAEPRRSQLEAKGLLGMPGRSWAERRIRALADAPTTKLATTIDFTPQ